MKDIVFKDIVLGMAGDNVSSEDGKACANTRKYGISLGLCENISFEKIRTVN